MGRVAHVGSHGRARDGARRGARAHAAGFTYLGLLIAVAVVGLMMSQAGILWRTQAQREREEELLFIGHEFKAAIASYYGSGGHQYPQELADLLEDKRFSEPRHHLRRLYRDPMTGAADWTLVRTDLQGITGIASSSQAEPLKKAGFAEDEIKFADATCYCDWQFVYTPRFARRRAGVAQPPAD
jgi:type II secretory pathway pseudopilin PulG